VRWAIRRTEQVVRSGLFPTEGGTLEIELKTSEFPLIDELASRKTCRYQAVIEGELFCSAADRVDDYATGQEGLRYYAPTSQPVCQDCNLSDSDILCSHFVHPKVRGPAGTSARGYGRALVSQQCELGRNEIRDPSECRASGHPCWERLASPELQKSGTAVSPRELPTALDFLDVTWRLAFDRPLLRMRSAESVAGLVLPCLTREEFAQRLSELADLMKLMDIADDLLPDDKKTLNKGETLNRFMAAIAFKFGDEGTAPVDAAIKLLQAINKARWALQHAAARSDLPVAFAELGIRYPIEDYAEAWDTVRVRAIEAVTALRKLVQSGVS
jgi:hypothetical protein